MFISAFTATSTFAGLTPGVISGITGIGLSTDNAIPKYVGATGDTIESSGILITDNNDILMQSASESAIVLTRYGAVGAKTDPTFAYGRIVPNGDGVPVLRTLGGSLTDPERTLSELGLDGSLTLYSDDNGKAHFTLTEMGRAFPYTTFETGSSSGWYLHSPSMDQDAQAFYGLEGVSTFVVKTGATKASLLTRVSVTEDSMRLFDSVALDMTEFASHPSPPDTGEVRIYPLDNGTMFSQDDAGNITPLTPYPVVTHEANYKGKRTNGYLKNGDSFSNLTPFVVPFDADILSITAKCSSAVNAWRADIHINGSPTALYSLPLTAVETSVTQELPAVILNKDQTYGIRLQKGPAGSGSGPNIPDPSVSVYLRKRVN